MMIVLMFLQGRPLKTPATSGGILTLEFAPTQMDVDAVLDTWAEASTPSTDIINTAIVNTKIDFVFLFCYSLFLMSCALQLSLRSVNKKIWQIIAGTSVIAGLLDVVENIGMLQSLQENGSDRIALMTTLAAYFKWALVLIVITFLIIGFLKKILQRKNKHTPAAS